MWEMVCCWYAHRVQLTCSGSGAVTRKALHLVSLGPTRQRIQCGCWHELLELQVSHVD
jgi:hypothetical protein